jgi:hypothetical protein
MKSDGAKGTSKHGLTEQGAPANAVMLTARLLYAAARAGFRQRRDFHVLRNCYPGGTLLTEQFRSWACQQLHAARTPL